MSEPLTDITARVELLARQLRDDYLALKLRKTCPDDAEGIREAAERVAETVSELTGAVHAIEGFFGKEDE